MTISKVLQRVADFVENDNWMDWGEYIIFGWKEYLEEHDITEALEMLGEETNDNDLTDKIISRVAPLLKQRCLPKDVVDKGPLQKLVRLLCDHEIQEVCIATALLRRIPAFVERSRLLDLMPVEEPIEEVNCYLQEATECYLFGLNVACVIICRSALECALERRLQKVIPQSALIKTPSNKGRLEWLIDLGAMCSLFKDKGIDITSDAHNFRRFSNSVIHTGKVPKEAETRNHLEMLRTLVCMIMRKSP